VSIPTTLTQSAITLEGKMAWWISRRLNLLFRCGPGVSVAAEVRSAFHKSGLRWLEISASCVRDKGEFAAHSEEALVIDGLDRVPKRLRPAVLDTLSVRMIWASVSVAEDDFDIAADPLHAEDFDVVVDVPCRP
jgi:hypothetical protein